MNGLPRIIRDIQKATGENQAELARRFNVTQATVSRWLAEKQMPEVDQRDRILSQARALGVIKHANGNAEQGVPIVGYVGAGGAVVFEEGQGPFGEAQVPPGKFSPTLVAVVVQGDSMSGLMDDGSLVYYESRHEPPGADLYGKLCVIGLEDGRVLIKKLYPGRRLGCYDLHSYNTQPLLDQPVSWAARVTFIAPK